MELSSWIRRRTPPTAAHAADSYGLLLALLVGAFLLFSTSPGVGSNLLFAAVSVTVLMLALWTSRAPTRWLVVGGIASAVAVGIALIDASSLPTGRALGALAGISAALLLVGAPVAIVRRILSHRRVSGETILGAVCVYLLLGFIFAAAYSGLDAAGSAPFFAEGPGNRAEYLYYSFTVLTTLGFGDLTAAGNFGRAVSVLEAVVGQVFLVTLVARLVGLFGMPARSGPSEED